jgi:predicted dehydrogenase
MKPFRIAVLGTGPMAAQHVQALRNVSGLEITTSVSRDARKAQAFAQVHAIPAAVDYARFLQSADADAVWVVVPADVAHNVAIELAGTRLPLFLEKPIGMSLAQTRTARDKVDVPHMVGVNRRFYEVLRKGKQLIKEAGGLTGIEIHMPENIKPLEQRYSRYVLERWAFGNSIHLVDLYRFFAGEPTAVHAVRRKRTWWDRSVVATLEFDCGALGVFHAHWGAPGAWRVAVTADELQIVFQPIERGMVLKRGQEAEPLMPLGADSTVKAGLTGQAEAFRDLLATGTLPEGAVDLADYEHSAALVAELFGDPDQPTGSRGTV